MYIHDYICMVKVAAVAAKPKLEANVVSTRSMRLCMIFTCLYRYICHIFQNKVTLHGCKENKVSLPWMLHSFLIISLAINCLTMICNNL